MVTGFKREGRKFKDYSFHRTFGVASFEIQSTGLLDVYQKIKDKMPIVYQQDIPSCVECSITFIKQWLEQTGIQLSWEYLLKLTGLSGEGTKPSVALDNAYKKGICAQEFYCKDVEDVNALTHRIPGYFYLETIDAEHILSAINTAKCPILIGISNYQGMGDHMVAGFDLEEYEGKTLISCFNWWKAQEQDIIKVPIEEVVFAAAICEKPNEIQKIPFWKVLLSKISI